MDAGDAHVPPGAAPVAWGGTPEPGAAAHRYGVLRVLLGAGVDASRIRVFHDADDGGAYWVVTPEGGRAAVLTDDTERYVGHLEGPWPFKAVFLGPDGSRTRIDHSIDALTAQVVRWCTEAAPDV
ncbi:hypothetical protein ABZZ17_04210 [Streptomyces sp. NPDC006512]|uniref:hypothetical protein n=1 Tax=Streptomyces sp. NPDC006512 TaxID=3154307 RepID=UPI0033B1BEC2